VSEQFEHEIEEAVGITPPDGIDAVDYERLRAAEHRAHEVAGAIYGTILATTVVAALGHDPAKIDASILIVVVTSAVFYAAHVYSLTVAARMVTHRPLKRSEVRGIAKAEWPMLQSSWPVLVPLLLGTLGIIDKDAASDIAMMVGIGALFVYGVLLSWGEGRGRLHVVWNALIVGSFGLLILLLKVFVH
jgi:hypothetical protein